MRWILFLFIPCLIISSCSPKKSQADKLFYNGHFSSYGTEVLNFEALAVKDGKILAHGSASSLEELYEFSEKIDLKGSIIYPGFHDAHCHFWALGKGLDEVDLKDKKSWRETVQAVEKYYKDHPGKKWIIGRGWDQNLWAVKTFPDRKLLDSLFPDIPVILSRIDGHAVIVNRKVLQLSGITANTRVDGGEIQFRIQNSNFFHDEDLSGILVDNAVDLARKAIPEPGFEEQKKWLLDAEEVCLSYGITAVTDAGLPLSVVRIIDSLHKTGDLRIRMNVMLNPGNEEFEFAATNGIFKTPSLNVSGFKLYADGALGSWGALLKQPYCDHSHTRGLPLNNSGYFDSVCSKIKDLGFQANTHCIGDSANRLILEIYGRHLKGKNDARWRIEHAQVVSPGDFELFSRYSVIPSVQPTHATSDMPWVLERLCSDRMNGGYAYKKLYQAAGILPLGTDFPVEEVNPYLTYLSAVYRKNKNGEPEGGFYNDEALSSEITLRGMTYWPAYAAFREKEWGSFVTGAYADFIVLAEPLEQTEPAALPFIKPLSTWISGNLVAGKN